MRYFLTFILLVFSAQAEIVIDWESLALLDETSTTEKAHQTEQTIKEKVPTKAEKKKISSSVEKQMPKKQPQKNPNQVNNGKAKSESVTPKSAQSAEIVPTVPPIQQTESVPTVPPVQQAESVPTATAPVQPTETVSTATPVQPTETVLTTTPVQPTETVLVRMTPDIHQKIEIKQDKKLPSSLNTHKSLSSDKKSANHFENMPAPKAEQHNPKAEQNLQKKEQSPEKPVRKSLCQNEKGCVSVILFNRDSSDLNAKAVEQMDKVYLYLLKHPNRNLRFEAYSSPLDESGHKSRRLSLSRALALRSYLVDKGIRSTRIELRPLGFKSESDPADKVEIIILKR